MPASAAEAQAGGATGLVYLRVQPDGASLDGAKAVVEGLTPAQQAAVVTACGAAPRDLLLVAAGQQVVVNRALDRVRQYVAKDLGLVQARALGQVAGWAAGR